MCFGVTPFSDGAYLPPGSAPPEPAKLWHAVQLVRKNSPPRTTDSLLTPSMEYASFGGMAGPGPREATYAARASVSLLLYRGGFLSAWTPGRAIGMRPVPTWKSTAAAPTPTREGPYWLPSLPTTPSPWRPWQEAQPTRKS